MVRTGVADYKVHAHALLKVTCIHARACIHYIHTHTHIYINYILLKKKLVSRNELRETENIGATDLDVLIANFLLQVCEFLFLNGFVRGYLYSLVVCVKSPHSLVPRLFGF